MKPTLSGTGTPAPGSLPDTQKSPLLSFADSLDEAVNLARKKRNASSLNMMKPFQGTVAASDFNSILGNLNAASDKTSSNLIKRATEAETGPDASSILTSTNDAGVITARDKTTGAVLWKSAPGEGNVQGGGNTLIRTGALNYTKEDYSDDASELEKSRGTDGWVEPTVYKKLYDAWVASDGKIADFVKTFPPAQYVNPDNDWLPVYLRPKSSGVANPFAQ